MELQRYYDEVPKSRDVAKSLVYSSMGDFTKIEEKDRQHGDIVLIKLFGVESHIGVYIGNDQMLHTTIHSGCVIERLFRWRHLIIGYYRVVKNDTAS